MKPRFYTQAYADLFGELVAGLVALDGRPCMSYVIREQAKKKIADFNKRHPNIKPVEECFLFGLLKRTRAPSFSELIAKGEITPEEADEISTAQLLLEGF